MKHLITSPNIFEEEKLIKKLQRSHNISDSHERSWRKWLTDSEYSSVRGLDGFSYLYFSYGISEVIERFVVNVKDYRRVVVVEGEVEYYELIGSHVAKEVVVINDPFKFNFQKGDLFCISQPFSETGNIYRNLNELFKFIKKNGSDIFLDMAYFGTFLGVFFIPEQVDYIAFSLSKSLGAPGLRAGAFFSKRKMKLFELRKYVGNSGTYQMHKSIQLMNDYKAGELASYYWKQYEFYGRHFHLNVTNTVAFYTIQDESNCFYSKDFVRKDRSLARVPFLWVRDYVEKVEGLRLPE